jgi:hypothetical protein
MARCNDCNKMVSYDTEVDPEEDEELHVDDDKVVGSFRRVLQCADCGTDLRETTLAFEMTIVPEEGKEQCDGGPNPQDYDHKWELDGDRDVSPTMQQGSRYAKTYYGIEVSGATKCEQCGATGTFHGEEKEAASFFDEC